MITPTPAFEMVPAGTLDDAALAELFVRAYTGYFVPVHVTDALLRTMVRHFDLDLEASRVAIGSAGPVGIAMLGLRGERAWIGGMGVAPASRRAGVGRALMQAAIAQARARAVRVLGLEVLEQNAGAIALYEALGFRRLRELEVWALAAPLAGPGGAPRARELPAAEARAWIAAHRAAPEPWQRADESLDRFDTQAQPLRGLEVHAHGQRLGAAVGTASAERASLLQLATTCVRPEDTARALCVAARAWAPVLRFLNVPADAPAAAVLRAAGATLEARQLEMALELPAGA